MYTEDYNEGVMRRLLQNRLVLFRVVGWLASCSQVSSSSTKGVRQISQRNRIEFIITQF